MSTWMYGEDMDKVVDRAYKEKESWEALATDRDTAMNLLIDRMLDVGEASWLLTHPNNSIRMAAFGRYSSKQTK